MVVLGFGFTNYIKFKQQFYVGFSCLSGIYRQNNKILQSLVRTFKLYGCVKVLSAENIL